MAVEIVVTHPGTVHASTRHDAWTVGAVAVIVYALSSLLHEAVGHGGVCLAVHGTALELSSMHFECALPDNAAIAQRVVAAGGTIATVIGGGVALLVYHLSKGSTTAAWRYALWLFAAVNLMQGTGYFLFSGLAEVGDWTAVIDGWEPHWLWRSGLTIMGFVLYLVTTTMLFRALEPMVGEARPRRFRHALRLAGLAYVVGCALEIAAGLRNPGGIGLVLMSGAAASLGGTSGLAWGPQTLRGPRTPSNMAAVPVELVERNWAALALAVVCGIAFIGVFGPGLAFHV